MRYHNLDLFDRAASAATVDDAYDRFLLRISQIRCDQDDYLDQVTQAQIHIGMNTPMTHLELKRFDERCNHIHDRLCQVLNRIPAYMRGIHTESSWRQVLEEH